MIIIQEVEIILFVRAYINIFFREIPSTNHLYCIFVTIQKIRSSYNNTLNTTPMYDYGVLDTDDFHYYYWNSSFNLKVDYYEKVVKGGTFKIHLSPVNSL